MEIVTVCPHHTSVFGTDGHPDTAYTATLAEHCAMAERMGASGMLVFDFWQSLDPWITAQLILAKTNTVIPIVAVNPALAHPAVTARFAAGLSHLYNRRVDLNVVGGAKASDLTSLGVAAVTAGERYARTVDFIDALAAVWKAQPHKGPFYQCDAPPLEPPTDPGRTPRILAPASRSPESMGILPRLDRVLVMAKPRAGFVEEQTRLTTAGLVGRTAMIIGIVARATARDAWAAAREQFTRSRRDRLVAQAFNRRITSSQHTANLAASSESEVQDECLWYGADRIGMDAPKLVGSYDEVADALTRYKELGVRSLIVDLPFAPAEYKHISRALPGSAQ